MVRNRNGPKIVVRLQLDHPATLEILQVRFTASKRKLQIRMIHERVNILYDGKACDLVDSKEQPRKNSFCVTDNGYSIAACLKDMLTIT